MPDPSLPPPKRKIQKSLRIRPLSSTTPCLAFSLLLLGHRSLLDRRGKVKLAPAQRRDAQDRLGRRARGERGQRVLQRAVPREFARKVQRDVGSAVAQGR